MRLRLFALSLLLSLPAVAAMAQVIPAPEMGRTLFISNQNHKTIERLQPHGDQYDVFDIRRFALVGYAKLLGNRMIVYDLRNNIVATMRAELLPPNSPLSWITVVRDPDGRAIGFLQRQ